MTPSTGPKKAEQYRMNPKNALALAINIHGKDSVASAPVRRAPRPQEIRRELININVGGRMLMVRLALIWASRMNASSRNHPEGLGPNVNRPLHGAQNPKASPEAIPS